MAQSRQEFLTLMEGWDAYKPVKQSAQELAKVAGALRLLNNEDGFSKYRHMAMLEESITTSDFPYLFGQIIDRQLLANYTAKVADWKSYVKVTTVPDFNTVRREKLLGMDNELDLVPEKGEYLPRKPVNCRYEYAAHKYGRQFDISWESLINDGLGAFADIPTRFATAALRTEAKFVTRLYAAASGDGNPALFGASVSDCGQNITNLGQLPLTIANLETTIGLMQSQRNPDGEVISVTPRHLVVPPLLDLTAQAILKSTMKAWSDNGTCWKSAAAPPGAAVRYPPPPFLCCSGARRRRSSDSPAPAPSRPRSPRRPGGSCRPSAVDPWSCRIE